MKVKIIAELGINHQGKFELAREMIKEASQCGVDYIKGQKRNPRQCLTEEQYNNLMIVIIVLEKLMGNIKRL